MHDNAIRARRTYIYIYIYIEREREREREEENDSTAVDLLSLFVSRVKSAKILRTTWMESLRPVKNII